MLWKYQKFLFSMDKLLCFYTTETLMCTPTTVVSRVYYSGTRRGVLSWEPRLQWSGVQQQGWALEETLWCHLHVASSSFLVVICAETFYHLLNFHSTHMTPRVPKEPQLKELLKTFFHMPFIWWYYDLPISAKEIDHLG